MNDEDRDLIQHLASAAIRVARTPMTGVPIDSPIARAIFNLTLQLASMGFIAVKEAQDAAHRVSDEGFHEVMGDDQQKQEQGK